MGGNIFNQFHYHPQANKNVDGIFLVPKNKGANIPEEIPSYSQMIISTSESPLLKENKIINKVLGSFIAISLIFLFSILPIRILESGSNMNAKAKESFTRLEDVYQSVQEKDYDKAKIDLGAINKNINEINKELDDMGQKNIFVSKFSVFNDSSINDERFFNTVLALSKIGNILIDDMGFIEKINISNVNNDIPNKVDIFSDLKKINNDLENARNDFKTVKLNIANIDDSKMSDKERQYFSLIKQNIGEIEKYYNSAITLTENSYSLLGGDYDKKYLVLFQNNTEIRATGGFIGTYGILTVGDGKIKNIFIDSIYNPDGQISRKIEPPEPLKKITNNLAMRDANWYPDFSISAKSISSLYEIEGGFTPDGIIAFDTKTFTDLLGVTGPIQLNKYGISINKDNFIPITQVKTSVEYDVSENNPKKFLSDFAPLFIEQLSTQNKDKQSQILEILLNNIKEKHIQFYSPNSNVQKAFESINIAGRIKENEKSDYFAYIDSNIGGLKTSSQITDELNHEITINRNNKIIHKVVLTRKHSGTDINYAYLRFYLPKGSKIISTENFEKKDSVKRDGVTGMIYLEDSPDKYLGKAKTNDLDVYEESDKTVIGGWQVIKGGEEIISEITYQLPSNIDITNNTYTLLIQKQSGIVDQLNNISVIDLANQSSGSLPLSLRKDEFISIPLVK
jgi:hypothetical protein